MFSQIMDSAGSFGYNNDSGTAIVYLIFLTVDRTDVQHSR
jgi:hypothetical protein